jgi:thioredoxin reductase
MSYDVFIAGGGPAGLSAALVLGRARKRVLLSDAGPPRNAASAGIHGFVTRDGTPPAELRRIAREQLAPYGSVELRDERVQSVTGARGRFAIELPSGIVHARSVLLCVGMIDELPELPGYRELWGSAIFQCPYCHGWEVQDRAWGYIAPAAEWLEHATFLHGWTSDVVAFTDARFEVPAQVRERLAAARIPIEERRIRRIVTSADPGRSDLRLDAVELDDGSRIARDVLVARPPQRQAALVAPLGLALDEQGFVRVDDHGETSRPGVFAAGDLTTPMQGALLAAAAGARAAYRLNHGLTMEP